MKRIEDMTIDELRAALLRQKTSASKRKAPAVDSVVSKVPRNAKERQRWHKRQSCPQATAVPQELAEYATRCRHLKQVRDIDVKLEIVQHMIKLGTKCLDCGAKIQKFVIMSARRDI